MLVYLAIFLIATAVTAWALLTRVPLKMDIIRDRASLSREMADGGVENVFRLRLINAGEQARRYRVTVAGLPSLRIVEGDAIEVAPAAVGNATLVLAIDPGAAAAGNHPIKVTVEDVADKAVTTTEASKFIVQ